MSKAPSTTTPEQDMEQTRKLTQVTKPVKLYEQEATLGLIMRPVRTIIDTSEIKKAFGVAEAAIGDANPPPSPENKGEGQSQTTNADARSVRRAEEAISKTANTLRANLIAETDIRNKQESTVDEYGPIIAMPLPEKIKDSLRVNYSTSDLGFGAVTLLFGENVANSNKGGPSVADAAIGSASYVIRTLLASLPGGIGGLSQKLAGSIPNPFSAAIFEKVTPRKFNFNWTIQPQSAQESQNLRDVINHLRYWSLPNPSAQRLILEVPYEWELSFVGTNFLYSFSRCVMSNIDIDYSPNGFNSFMIDGAPQSVTIAIEFEEIFPLDKSTIDEGGAGAASMRPSGTLEERANDYTPSETQAAREEQAEIQNVVTSRSNYATAILERNKREQLYLSSKQEYDAFQSELRDRPDLYKANKVLYDRKLNQLTQNLNITTQFYNDALQNEQSAYNDYDSAWEQYKSTTQKEPSIKANPPAPSKISG